MKLSDIASEVSRLISASAQLPRMPHAHLQFHAKPHREHILATLRTFARPHPRHRLSKSKTVGISLIGLRRFKTATDYLDTVKKQVFAAYHSRRATMRGDRVRNIDRHFLSMTFTTSTHRPQHARDGRWTMPAG